MAEIKSLSHTHEAVLNWLVLNPEKSLREGADTFGYTQAWFSSLIHSDIFQHALKEKQMAIAASVALTLPQKIARVADMAVEKLTEQVEKTEDPEFILNATDKLLHRLGYAPISARNPVGGPGQPGQVAQQNNFFLQASDLEAARELMQLSATAPVPLPVPLEGVASRVEGE